MMRVTVEIWPGGDSKRARRMAVIDIANLSGLAPVSDYSVEAVVNPGQPDEAAVKSRVDGHVRADGWAALVQKVMPPLVAHVRSRLRRHIEDVDHDWRQYSWAYDDCIFTCRTCGIKAAARRGLPATSPNECRRDGITVCTRIAETRTREEPT